jgi:hypothetical protein
MSNSAELRTALCQRTREAVEAVEQLLELGTTYCRAASGPDGEPNRVNEATVALERAREELTRAIDCYANPEGGGT